ncbi:MAG TPA: glycosyltransferase, partial [Bryobacteraceae bacterium]|nr:glycosyltransferase [Bryobacteraceae bacterium]
MRVALDATYSVGSALSGVGVYSRQILFGLARREPESEFLFCYRSHRLLRSLLDRIPSNARRTLLLDDQGPPDCDVFHGLNQRLPAPNSPTPMVCTFHDLFVLTGEYSTPEFRARFADQARLAAERADCIIAVSRFTADQVQTLLGVDRGRVRVVHHGVQPPNPPPGIERESIVLHVGAIQTRKNISRLVEAFETMPKDWRLYFVGSSGFNGENILDQISQSPATSRIVLTGYVSMSQLEELYAR